MIGAMSAIALALGSAVRLGLRGLPRRAALAPRGGHGGHRLSQAAGFVALFVWLAADGFDLDARAFGIGALAALGGGIGLAAFYKALAVGTMSIVSPLAACGAIIPFAIASRPASGRRRWRLAVRSSPWSERFCASAEERGSERPGPAAGRSARDRGGRRASASSSTSSGSPGTGARHALGALRRARRLPVDTSHRRADRTRRSSVSRSSDLRVAVAIGLIDTGANALFVLRAPAATCRSSRSWRRSTRS